MMNINNKFEARVLSVAGSSRREIIKKNFDLRGVNFNFFDAPNQDQVKSCAESQVFSENYINNPWINRWQVMSCALGHRLIIAASDPEKWLIVFEDDVILPKNINVFLSEVFHLLSAEACFVTLLAHKHYGDPIIINKVNEYLYEIAPDDLNRVACAAAYMISPQLLSKIKYNKKNYIINGAADQWVWLEPYAEKFYYLESGTRLLAVDSSLGYEGNKFRNYISRLMPKFMRQIISDYRWRKIKKFSFVRVLEK